MVFTFPAPQLRRSIRQRMQSSPGGAPTLTMPTPLAYNFRASSWLPKDDPWVRKFSELPIARSKISYPPFAWKASTIAKFSQLEVSVRSKHPYGAMATWCVGFLLLVPSLQAQGAAPRHVGFPQDWSDHSIVFSLDGLARHPNLVSREHRIARQLMQRFKGPGSSFFRGIDFQANSAGPATHHRDWNVSLVRGRVATDMYPAKFTFDPGAQPSCANDYVVFGLDVAGTTGNQANLIAFNNLYAGPGGLCGAAPTVMWAYNVTTVGGGKVNLSPVISEDGTQIAFVESAAKTTIFHVLTWTAGQGTITNSAAPTMTTLLLSSTATSTRSSPWIDYTSNTAYVGVDGGQLYKITGAFTASPAIGWGGLPVTVSNGRHLTPPVLDNRLGVLMVGSGNGNLYQVNSTTGAVASLVVGATTKTTPGILAPPIVDVTNGTTFVVSANDGTSAVLVEVDTATLGVITKGRIGLGSSSGTPLTIPQPAFSNDYYNDPSTGVIRLCGTGAADTTPWQYSFGFTGPDMNATPVFSQQLVNAAATCSPWTEFYNLDLNGGTDFFFFGLNQNCVGASGCVIARDNTDVDPLVTAAVPGGPSGIVIDNYSTAAQASSIYLSEETGSTAYKFTQNGLN